MGMLAGLNHHDMFQIFPAIAMPSPVGIAADFEVQIIGQNPAPRAVPDPLLGNPVHFDYHHNGYPIIPGDIQAVRPERRPLTPPRDGFTRTRARRI